MTIAAISGYLSSHYDVRSHNDLVDAQNDVAVINKMNVSGKDYKDAEATHGWGGILNPFTDKYAKESLITTQNNLEKDAEQHLVNIAAANVHRQVSPAVLKQAQTVAGELQKRLDQNVNSALQANQDDYANGHDSQEVDVADDLQDIPYAAGIMPASLTQLLEVGSKPDAIPLSGTQSFINGVLALDKHIVHDFNELGSHDQATAGAARKQLLGPDLKKFDAVASEVWNQALPSDGTDAMKAAVLPNGDPEKTAWLAQEHRLLALYTPAPPGSLIPDLDYVAGLYHGVLATSTPGY